MQSERLDPERGGDLQTAIALYLGQRTLANRSGHIGAQRCCDTTPQIAVDKQACAFRTRIGGHADSWNLCMKERCTGQRT